MTARIDCAVVHREFTKDNDDFSQASYRIDTLSELKPRVKPSP
ncbi:hypothetical protein [Streptomyces olindensis]